MTERAFISYSSVDSQEAERIARLLDELDIGFYRFEEQKPAVGQPIQKTCLEAIRDSTLVVLVISPASQKSEWVNQEIGMAQALGRRILPYLTHPALDVPESIKTLPHVHDLDGLRACFTGSTVAKQRPKPERLVLVVGGANAEYILRPAAGPSADGGHEFELGGKHEVFSRSHLGGSGANQVLRLLYAGVPALPILAVGNDDLGREIRDAVAAAVPETDFKSAIQSFVETDEFFVPGLSTPRTTIVVEPNARRTIFKERTAGMDRFRDHLIRRVDEMAPELRDKVAAVMVGHVEADRASETAAGGECTKYLVRQFVGQAKVCANWGRTQLQLGHAFWREELKRLTVLQGNLMEMKMLFARRNGHETSLPDVLDELTKQRLTAVITLQRFGAVCTHKDSADMVILAWPIELPDAVDSTGAGDAFLAGLVSQVYEKPEMSLGDLYAAIQDARVWGAYACTSLGGASNCADIAALHEFRKKIPRGDAQPVQIKHKDEVREILFTLDRAFQ